MKLYLKSIFALFVFVSLAACSSFIGGQKWFENHKAGKASLAKRASFDLSCSMEQLEYVGLGGGQDYSSVGVSGCDKKVVYVFVDNSKWVLNTGAKQ